MHGAGNVVPGLERELTGKTVGDRLKVVVHPPDGYGVRNGPEPQKVPLSSFADNAQLENGMEIVASGPNGEMLPLWVVGLGRDHALLDHNHPLAGVTLHFDVEVAAVRAATADEVAAGQPAATQECCPCGN